MKSFQLFDGILPKADLCHCCQPINSIYLRYIDLQATNQLISSLERFIRKFYINQILKGLGLLLVILLPLFLVFVYLEYLGHFSIEIRTFLFYTFILTGSIILIRYILFPLFKLYGISKNRLSHDEAAGIIGNHFSEIKDKLINAMQLSVASVKADENELLIAGVNQKMDEIKPFNFTLAINKKESGKMLRYAGLAILLLAIVSIFQGNMVTEGSKRLINYNREFVRKAPFLFHFKTPKTLKKGDNLNLILSLVGDEIPADAYLFVNNEWVKMKSDVAGKFSFELRNLQANKVLKFRADDFESVTFEVPVISAPSLSQVQIELDYPNYIGRKSETKNTTSDLIIPEGTKVTWNLKALNTDQLDFILGGKKLTGNGYYQSSIRSNTDYRVLLRNKILNETDSMVYGIEVVKDKFPVLMVEKREDSLSSKLLYFVGTANDDYGLSRLTFHYKIENEKTRATTGFKSIKVPIGKSNSEVFSFVFDLFNLDFELGSTMKCYFQVYDNDGINGAKSTKSAVMEYKAPTAEELENLSDQGNSSLVAQMDNAIKEAQEIQKMIKELQVKMNDSKTMDWQEKNKINNLLQKQKNLQKKVDQIKQQQEKIRTREDEFKKINPKVKEKQKILDDMFKKTMSEEMKELFKKLEELLKDENKQQINKQLDKMNQADKDVSKDLERLQEQLKQLELEKKIEETADKLDELAKKQEKLESQTKMKAENNETLAKKQEELKKEFDGIKKDLDKIEEKNKELKDKLDLNSTQEDQKSIEQEMGEAKESLDKGKNKKAGESQKQAGEKMKQLSKKMKQNLESEMKKREAEDYKTLRQLLENLIALSHEQENTMKEFKKQPGYSPRFIELAKQQQKIKRDAEMIEDSLLALSKRNIKIQSFVNTEIGKINHHMEKTVNWLSERNTYMAAADQQYVMTSVNNLAVMLSESLKNMQMEMNQKQKSGSKKVGQCKKPGMGDGKSGAKPKKGGKSPSMGTLKELQGDLNKMGKERKEGKKNGTGKNGAMTSEDFVRMANQQEALRRAIQAVQQKLKEEGKTGALGDLNKTQKLMEQTEKDLVNKKFDAQTIQRQKEIEIRLSKHEEAEIKQEQDEKRQGETAKEKPRVVPPSLQPYIEELKRQQEILKTLPAEMLPYYQNKVKSYYILL